MIRKGRFSQPAAEIALRYSESVSFDWRLYRHDIAGSIAHAIALAEAGVISGHDRDKIDNGLRAIEKEIESGKFEWDESRRRAHEHRSGPHAANWRRGRQASYCT